MNDNTVVLIHILLRGSATIAAVVGAVFLANQGKDGWGWLIFLALLLGCFSVSLVDGGKKNVSQ